MSYHDRVEKEDAVNGLIYRIRNEMLKTYPCSEYNIDVILSGLHKSLLEELNNDKYNKFFNSLQECIGVHRDMGHDMFINIREDFDRIYHWNCDSLIELSIIVSFSDPQWIPNDAYEIRINLFPASEFEIQSISEYMTSAVNQFTLNPDEWDDDVDDDFNFLVSIYDISDPTMSIGAGIARKETTDKRITKMKEAINKCYLKQVDEYGFGFDFD